MQIVKVPVVVILPDSERVGPHDRGRDLGKQDTGEMSEFRAFTPTTSRRHGRPDRSRY